MLEQQGAEKFFRQGPQNSDLMRTATDGRGIDLGTADKLMQALRLYATFLL